MAENERISPSSDDTSTEITNLDGSLQNNNHTNRRQFIRRGLGTGLAVTTGAGLFGGEQAVSHLIQEKNQAVKKLDETQLREQQAETQTAFRLNAYKQFMYEKVLSSYIGVLTSPDGHSGSLSRFVGFLSHPGNTAVLTDAMRNGKYEQRTEAFIRMKETAVPFLEAQYEAIEESKAPGGFYPGEPYSGSKEAFIAMASDLIAYATSRGAQPEIGKNPQFPLQELVNDEPLLYIDDLLAIATNTRTAEIYTPTGAQQLDPRQYFLTKLSEVSATLQQKVVSPTTEK